MTYRVRCHRRHPDGIRRQKGPTFWAMVDFSRHPPEVFASAATTDALLLTLLDGRQLTVPWVWASARLAAASAEARASYVIPPHGRSIRWPELDEDLSVEGLARDFGALR